MAEAKESSKAKKQQDIQGITKISVRGYKSIKDECTIELYPLTILAGANSSGKSSIMQPLLLMKQTLEAPYDPGALLLNGPNVRFTSVEQLLTKQLEKNSEDSFSIEIELDLGYSIKNTFKRDVKKAIDIVETYYRKGDYTSILSIGMTEAAIDSIGTSKINNFLAPFFNHRSENISSTKWKVIRERCYLKLELEIEESSGVKSAINTLDGVDVGLYYTNKIIHVPGLRGNPERTYPVTAIGDNFSGTFENYVAQVSTANLDPDGSFGDWPEDFGDVDLQEESRYLDAADKKLAQKSHG